MLSQQSGLDAWVREGRQVGGWLAGWQTGVTMVHERQVDTWAAGECKETLLTMAWIFGLPRASARGCGSVTLGEVSSLGPQCWLGTDLSQNSVTFQGAGLGTGNRTLLREGGCWEGEQQQSLQDEEATLHPRQLSTPRLPDPTEPDS